MNYNKQRKNRKPKVKAQLKCCVCFFSLTNKLPGVTLSPRKNPGDGDTLSLTFHDHCLKLFPELVQRKAEKLLDEFYRLHPDAPKFERDFFLSQIKAKTNCVSCSASVLRKVDGFLVGDAKATFAICNRCLATNPARSVQLLESAFAQIRGGVV